MKKVKWSILVLILFWFGGITQVQGEMESFESLKPLCDKNIFHSCFKLGERFRVLDRDNKKALPYFEKACLGDHLTACSHAGLLLFMVLPTVMTIKKPLNILKKRVMENMTKLVTIWAL